MTTPNVSTRPLRVLVVDDERLPRQRLMRLLEEIPNTECAGECANTLSTGEENDSSRLRRSTSFGYRQASCGSPHSGALGAS